MCIRDRSCIVGRVLAASTGAADVMGWISAPYPNAHNNEWLTIESTPLTIQPLPASIISPRSALFPRSEIFFLTSSDFTYPTDSAPIYGNEVLLTDLRFTASDTYELTTSSPRLSSSAPSTDTTATLDATPASTASLTFTSPSKTRLPPLTLALRNEVYFIAAQPCFPRRSSDRSSKKHSVSPSWSTSADGKDKDLPARPCHALYKTYQYKIEPIAGLVSERTRIEACVSHLLPNRSTLGHDTEGKSDDTAILVLDCRGTRDAEVLGRAWCASIGIHAVIAREGRTCLGCCVREARGLDIGVVLRV